METNDWILLNSIIYKLYYIEDIDEMRLTVIKMLGRLIDFDAATFYLASADGSSLERPVGTGINDEELKKYSSIYINYDYASGIFSTGRNFVYRESDIISDRERVKTKYYKEMYDTNKWHYSLELNISFHERFLGALSFYRRKGKSDFDGQDIFVLDMIKDNMALRLHQHFEKQGNKKYTLVECIEEFELTHQESVILEGILTGKEGKQLCEELAISNNTLKKHMNNIYKKTGMKSRLQLIQQIQS